MKKATVIALILGFVLVQCKKDDDTSDDVKMYPAIAEYTTIDINSLYNYANQPLPEFIDVEITKQLHLAENPPITDKGATLGRVLFYDKALSRNNTISCSSCHKQELGFADADQFSTGFDGGKTGAHSMRLYNVGFFNGKTMFWNKRATTLEAQSTMPIQDHIEMGFDVDHGGFDALIAKMNSLTYYPQFFEWVYGDPTITEQRVQIALAEFMRSMQSFNSKFDIGYKQTYGRAKYNKGVLEDFPNFTDAENRGKFLFIAHISEDGLGCGDCHVTPTFTFNKDLGNNGLDEGETTKFKAPSLKNVAVTGPYMHDGRIATLEEVVEHYNTGIKAGPFLDEHLVDLDGNPIKFNLSEQDKYALVAFLKTLTDSTTLTDPRFSSPFKD